MFRYIMKSCMIVSLLLCPWSLARASQPLSPVERQPAFRQERKNLPSPEEREQVRKRIELIKMWRLTEELNLDEETGSKLFPLLRQYEEKRRELTRKKEELLFALKGQLKSGNPPEDRIKGLLKEWEGIRADEQELNQKEKEDLKGILSLEQQARYLIFQQEFTRAIRRVIADVREKRPASSPSRMNIPAKP
jgi:Spy/CpxP family protein refolding chaperone